MIKAITIGAGASLILPFFGIFYSRLACSNFNKYLKLLVGTLALGFVGPFMVINLSKISFFFGVTNLDERKVVWWIYVTGLLISYVFVTARVIAFRKNKMAEAKINSDKSAD